MSQDARSHDMTLVSQDNNVKFTWHQVNAEVRYLIYTSLQAAEGLRAGVRVLREYGGLIYH